MRQANGTDSRFCGDTAEAARPAAIPQAARPTSIKTVLPYLAMKIFITGGSGFVGRNLIEMSLKRGAQVLALARSDSAAAAVRAAGAEPVRGDLDDESSLRTGMAGCQVVFHSAAYVQDWGEPAAFHRGNVEGTEHVLAAARSANVPRFVHVSTEAVLVGGPPIHKADETWPRAQNPIGQYPLTKGLAEDRVLAANSPQLATCNCSPTMIWVAAIRPCCRSSCRPYAVVPTRGSMAVTTRPRPAMSATSAKAYGVPPSGADLARSTFLPMGPT